MDDEQAMKIARLVHGELCTCEKDGCSLVDDLFLWIANGDAQELTEADVPALAAEWREWGGE